MAEGESFDGSAGVKVSVSVLTGCGVARWLLASTPQRSSPQEVSPFERVDRSSELRQFRSALAKGLEHEPGDLAVREVARGSGPEFSHVDRLRGIHLEERPRPAS